MFSSKSILVLFILSLSVTVLHAGQIEWPAEVSVVEESDNISATQVQHQKTKRRWFKRKKDDVAGPRTGFWGLVSSIAGGVILWVSLYRSYTLWATLLAGGLVLFGVGMGIATLFREKGKPRSLDWKFALAAIIVGSVPILLVSVFIAILTIWPCC